MSLRIQSDAEPIAGYRLIERLGGGGFGEVWKAEAPGGLLKAIKIIHGPAGEECSEAGRSEGDGESEVSRAEQEYKALKRVQSVRHPYLLSLERFDVVDGRLLIVMELADKTLWDRFRECRTAGLTGIPRDDLLRHMQEAAEVLDLMNVQHNLQHLDIKPQNLFLVHDHVKVADFGLVKDLEGRQAEVTGGVTPVYAAPETFDGLVTRFCDQYSLAIVYQELLTGQRPFAGTTVQQLIMQHLRGTPNLASLPPGDRIVLMRALAKNPEERFPSCQAMVRALYSGVPAAGAGVIPRPDAPPAPAADTRRNGSDASGVIPRPPSLPSIGPMSTPATLVRLRREDFPPAADVSPPREAPPELTGSGVLCPAVVVGLGRGGLDVLCRVRQALTARFGRADRLPNLRLIGIDTDAETTSEESCGGPDATLAAEEVLLTRLNRPGHYLKPRRNGRSLIEGWFDAQMLYRIPRNPATLGVRCLGRLAFCDHYRNIAQKLRLDLETASHPDTLAQAERATRLGLRTNRPRVYVVASLAGGTGGGMFLDAAYAARHRLRLLGYGDDTCEVVGVLLLPPSDRGHARPPALANAFASLTELHHFSLPGTTFTASYDDKDGHVSDDGPPFQRTLVLAAQAHGRPPEALAADLVVRELTTPFGRETARLRGGVPAPPPGGRVAVTVSTFGLSRISWPRGPLVEDAARQVVRRVLDRWTTTEAAPVRERVAAWVGEQWAAQQLGPEHLIARMQQAAEKAAGQVPEALFQALVAPFQPKGFWSRPKVTREDALAVLARLESLVGTPGESVLRRQTGQVAEAVQEVADRVLRELGTRIAPMAVCLAEQPDFRLAGADEAVEQIKATFERVLEQYEPTAAELGRKSEQAHDHCRELLNPDSGRRLKGGELAEALRLYATWRFQFLLVKQAALVYTGLRSQVSDAHREVALCRARLLEVARQFAHREPTPDPDGQLLPEGCATLTDAADRLLAGVADDDLRGLDRRLQAVIEQQFTSIVHTCMSSSGLLTALEGVLLQQAREFVTGRLGPADVAGMFLARHSRPGEASRAIGRAYEEAAPELARFAMGGRPLEVLVVPPGEAGEPLTRLARETLSAATLETLPGHEEVALYREVSGLPLGALPHTAPAAEDAYHQTNANPATPAHTRTDVREWFPIDPG
jgi:serine/threonine protein kinase